MDTLEQVLQSVLQEVTFEPAWPVPGIATGEGRMGQRITPERLRELHVAAAWRDNVLGRAGAMFPSMSAPLRARLTASLRQTLSRWLDTDDRIGHALPVGPDEHSSAASNGPLWDVQYVSSLKSFADGIVQGAAVLGAERVCSLLADWGRGSPVPVRIVGVLDQLPVDRTVAPGRGIRIEPLPTVSDDLPAWLPDKPGLLDFAYLGRTLVSVEAEAAPALFHPEDPTAGTGPVRMTLNADLNVDDVCKTLSLLCAESHAPAFQWHHHGDLVAFGRGAHGWEWSGTGELGVMRQTDRLRYQAHSGGFNLTRQARSLDEEQLRQLVAGMRSSSRQVKVTIDRWIRAKGAQTDLVDQLIDMRIALESLFLSGDVRGVAFTLALRGAWYLGQDAAGRKAAFAKLRRAYGAGSGAVHRGEVADDGSAREALADGLELCRSGILKMLAEGPPAPWLDIVLGVDGRP